MSLAGISNQFKEFDFLSMMLDFVFENFKDDEWRTKTDRLDKVTINLYAVHAVMIGFSGFNFIST